MDKFNRLLEALYTMYGGSGRTKIVDSAVASGTLEGAIASIEIREDGAIISHLYEPDNTENLVTDMGIDGVELVKGIDTLTNGKKGFSKVICTAGTLKVNMKS